MCVKWSLTLFNYRARITWLGIQAGFVPVLLQQSSFELEKYF